MKIFASLALAFSLLASPLQALNLFEQLQAASLTIKTPDGHGSGVAFRNNDGSVVIWTAQHVVKKHTEVLVLQDIEIDGMKVGELSVRAIVLASSEFHDVAILQPAYSFFIKHFVSFDLDWTLPSVGDPVIHVGSWHGLHGSQSVSVGVVSKLGRYLDNDTYYDQITATATPGSSGGGAFLANGQCIGFVTKQANINFNLVTPIRRVKDWAMKSGYMWALNPDFPRYE